jgi:pimeloyl-ACP methyl ester carboxylesterase
MQTTSAPLARPNWLTPAVWPFETRTIQSDGVAIAVTDVGTGPTLLFVHTGMWSFVWRDLLLRLSDEFRCVTFDAPGTGRSGRPGRRGTTLAAAARATGAVVDQLDLDDVTLVLHDLGGLAGLAAAAHLPKRIGAIVAINTFGWRPTGPAFRGMLALMGSAPMRELDVLTNWLPRFTASNAGVGRHLDKTSRRAFRAGIDRSARRSFHRYMRDARNPDALLEDVNRAVVDLGGRPLLTIFGEKNDPLHFQPQWKSRFANTRQLVVSNGHHFPMCDDPDLVAQSIRTWVSQTH